MAEAAAAEAREALEDAEAALDEAVERMRASDAGATGVRHPPFTGAHAISCAATFRERSPAFCTASLLSTCHPQMCTVHMSSLHGLPYLAPSQPGTVHATTPRPVPWNEWRHPLRPTTSPYNSAIRHGEL